MTKYMDNLDSLFHALADPTRRAVLAKLSSGQLSISELAQPFDMALPSFVQHIKVLENSGLIRSTKVGRVRTCEVVPEAFSEAESWLAARQALWEGRMDRLEAFLEQNQEDQ